MRTSAQDTVSIADGRSFPDARFYFKGEGHEYPAENAHALLALLKYTYAHKNVRYLVMECGPDQAYLANYYLQNGGDSFPSKSFLYMKEAFWKKLYEFNIGLPLSDRIRVYGFDFNRFIHTSRALKLMFKNNPAVSNADLRNSIFKLIDWEMESWDRNLQKYFEKDLELLRIACEGHADELKKLLGNDYPVFVSIVENKTPIISNVKRDKQMTPQLLNALPAMSGGNILFNYGIAHTSLDGAGVAKRLYSSKEFRDSVCSIFPYYRKGDKHSALVSIESRLSATDKQKAEQSPLFTLMPVDPSSKFSRAGWLLVH